MKRHLFTIVLAISLLLAVAVAGLWVRSYWWQDVMYWNGRQTNYVVASSEGHILAQSFRQYEDGLESGFAFSSYEAENVYDVNSSARDLANCRWSFFGFGVRFPESKGFGGPDFGFVVPHWFFVVIGLTCPIVWGVARLRGSSRTPKRKCSSCGYDLRASKDKCPECGAAIPIPAKAVGA